MTEVDNTKTVLYSYLQTLSVKVSRSTVHHLLNTPVGDSMRGISDALDALHIKNEVYQLPSHEYFSQLDAPFITMLQVDKNPFCVVTKKDNFIVEISNIEGKRRSIGMDNFLKKWTGTVLLGETTERTMSDSLYLWKNLYYYCLRYKLIIAIHLILALGFLTAFQQQCSSAMMLYLATLGFGILVSVAILYKEQFNENFLEQFCHIGKTVNCNKVLHSKGARIATASLGELSLLYFSVLFIFSVIQSQEFHPIAFICNVVAICFTIYSIIYQILIIHKGCILCIFVNLAVWVNALTLYIMKDELINSFSIFSVFTFFAIGSICLILGMTFNSYCKEYKEKQLLRRRLSQLMTTTTFHKLLELQPSVKEEFTQNTAINNHLTGEKRLLIITNPNCKNCAEIHSYIKKLATEVPISLMLLTSPNDNKGKQVAEIILTAYLQYGWDKAMQLLEEWFENHKFREPETYVTTPQTEEMRKQQLLYCHKQSIDRTPSFIMNRHYVPEVYSFSSLRYVLT